LLSSFILRMLENHFSVKILWLLHVTVTLQNSNVQTDWCSEWKHCARHQRSFGQKPSLRLPSLKLVLDSAWSCFVSTRKALFLAHCLMFQAWEMKTPLSLIQCFCFSLKAKSWPEKLKLKSGLFVFALLVREAQIKIWPVWCSHFGKGESLPENLLFAMLEP